MVKDILIKDFDYELPEGRIPKHPLEKRDECKLLVSTPEGKVYHRIFKELPDLLPVGTLMVCNDTKVINARLEFHKLTGASIELFLLEPIEPSDYALNFQSRQTCKWKCLVGNSKKWKDGAIYAEIPMFKDEIVRMKAIRIKTEEDGSSEVEFFWNDPLYNFANIIEKAGRIPIPPYLNRESEEQDKKDYQTIYAYVKGSVAAPTAGLHFTSQVFEGLEAHAVKTAKVTLHVGAGTFKPVKSDAIGNHAMHAEPFTVSRELIEQLIEWKEKGKPVVAIGTTSVRTLESLPYIGKALINGKNDPYIVSQWESYESEGNEFDTITALKVILEKMKEENLNFLTASTSIIIAPGFRWRIVTGMVTNFHQPKSTLLLLVSSFLGGEKWRRIYEEALSLNYRFLSYGDACLFIGKNLK